VFLLEESKEDEMGGTCSTHRRDGKLYKMLTAKSGRETSPGSHTSREEDDMKKDVKETERDDATAVAQFTGWLL
jgi:hypothetical protein